jgi:septal ring factor EnvC (AmiA/AmiB activator)
LLSNKEEDIVEVCVDEEEELLKFKEFFLFELGNVSMEIRHYSISFEYLEKCINEVLEKYPKNITKLRKMLKEQEESKQIQLEEKEEEIKRIKNEIINEVEEKKKVDDGINKILEVNGNLKTQIE